jgi:TfoX/Sxy family transcriptional regulator of competence genes
MDRRHDADRTPGIRTAELTRQADAGGFYRMAAPLLSRQVRSSLGEDLRHLGHGLTQRTDRGPLMAYDEGLAERIRQHLGADPDVAQKRMFGGIAFLLRGNMAVGVTGDDLMVRVGPEATDAALARPGARLFDMTGRPMRGWVVVDSSALAEDEALGEWIDEGYAFAAGLPPK